MLGNTLFIVMISVYDSRSLSQHLDATSDSFKKVTISLPKLTK